MPLEHSHQTRSWTARLGNPSTQTALFSVIMCVLLGFASTSTYFARDIDQQFRNFRDALTERPATGDVILVEVDAVSLARIARWPWPRSIYGRGIDTLNRAGVRSLAFDVDFSAASTPSEDRALAAALDRMGGGVALPTFVQSARLGDARTIETLPAPLFRDRSFQVAVNVFPDRNGLVRDYPYGMRTQGNVRPSLSAFVAESSGAIGQTFAIDQSIDPETIPRISFADLIDGLVAPERLRNKRVIVGATAIELGDRYAVPRHGVVPGALIQAQAAETLLQGRALPQLGPLPGLVVAALAIVAMFAMRGLRRQGGAAVGGMLAVAGLPLVLEATSVATVDIAPGLVALCAGAAIALITRLVSAFDRARLIDHETGLGNLAALDGALRRSRAGMIGVARISRFAELASLLGGADLARLVERLADRMSYVARDQRIYRVEEGVLAWIIPEDDPELVENGIAGLAALLKSPVVISGRTIEARASFGGAHARGLDAHSTVLKALFAADTAAAQSRHWQVHDDHLDAKADWNVALLSELDDAILNGQIWVAYQPKFDVARQGISSAEALVRWQHPTRGAIAPDLFIPIVEEAGAILPLTLFVLRDALRSQKAWLARGHHINVAVNVSAALLRDPELPDQLSAIIADAGAMAESITLEVTESATMSEQETSIAALNRVRAIGVRLSIDDYGTGQSTLTYLRRVPASEIKIDKSFILGMLHNRSDEILVRSSIELAHDLGFSVVAEGVENAEIAGKLAALGCDLLQGWHIGRPTDGQAFMELLERKMPLAA